MKTFCSRHRKLLIWLGADLALLILFWSLRPWKTGMEGVAAVSGAFRRWLGQLWSGTRISGMEILCVLLVLFVLAYLIWNIAAVARAKGRRGRRAVSALLGAVNAALAIYLGFCWLWGVNYYVDGFQEKSGVYAQPVSLEDLTAVTEYFARGLRETADSVPRDENGLFAIPREEILQNSVHAYDAVERDFPFLAFDDTPPKAVRFSRIMSLLDFTGVYCPYTGESNVNVDSPACLLPATAAHELAHQRGIASEQECNFLAILASTTCSQPGYAYSGWLLGYIYLGNALSRADYDAWEGVWAELPETVKADLRNNNAYWKQFQNAAVQKVSNTVYDSFLKSYGETLGLQTYGTVTDLLVVWYADAAKAG